MNTSEFSTHDGNTEAMLLHTKRRKIMESGCDVSLVNDASYDQPIHEINPLKGLQAGQILVGIDSMPTLEKDVIIIDDDDDEEDIQGRIVFNQKGKGKGFTLHQSHFFVYVVASASREHIFVQKKMILMHRVAFTLCVTRLLKVRKSHSMGHLFPRKILKKGIMMKYLENR